MLFSDFKSDFYEVSNLEEAMGKILTPEGGLSPTERWEIETPIILEILTERLKPTPDKNIIDYGCGVGRLAKELVSKTGCNVIGVDISRSMRAFSALYCASDSFFSCSKSSLRDLTDRGWQGDHAFSVWVLQHAENPQEDIELIYNALRDGGTFFVMNLEHRCLPTANGWENDGIDIKELIEKRFNVMEYFPPPKDAAPKLASLITFCAVYQKPSNGDNSG